MNEVVIRYEVLTTGEQYYTFHDLVEEGFLTEEQAADPETAASMLDESPAFHDYVARNILGTTSFERFEVDIT